jgi:hypothetical protein
VFDDYNFYKQSLLAVQPLTSGLQVFGEYQKAQQHYSSNELTGKLEIETIEVM